MLRFHYKSCSGDEYDDHHPAGFFYLTLPRIYLLPGFVVSIIELHISYAMVADVLSGEITKELAF